MTGHRNEANDNQPNVMETKPLSAGEYNDYSRIPPVLLAIWHVSSLPQVPCLFSGLVVSSGPQRLLSYRDVSHQFYFAV